MVMGIFAAALCALLQAFSYLSSAAFMKRYNSSFKLMVFSQIAMGIVSIPISLIFFPMGLFNKPIELIVVLLLWIAATCIGQFFFFATQKHIESSRLSSLLGLKIVVLAVFTAIFYGQRLKITQIIAILLATACAFIMNGGKSTRKITLPAIGFLMATVISYCTADLIETNLMKISASGNVWCDGLGVCATCYMILGFCMIPLLKKCDFSWEQLKHGSPFGVLYFFSQVALFVSFGLIGPVFANVIQSSRGIISVIIAIMLCRFGWGSLDAHGSRGLWIRRIICAIVMSTAIVLYACA